MLQSARKRIYGAIQQKSISLLEQALNESGVDVNAYRDHTGQTALHAAVIANWPKGIEFLLSNPKIQANLPIKSIGYTPLHSAVYEHLVRHNYKPLRILLNSQKIDVNAKNEDRETVFTMALKHNSICQVEVIKLILNHPKLELELAEMHEALCIAASGTDIELLDILFSDPRIHEAFKYFSKDGVKKIWSAASLSQDKKIKITVVFKLLMDAFKKKPDLTFENAKELLPGLESFSDAEKIFEYSRKMAVYPEAFIFCIGFLLVLDLFPSEHSIIPFKPFLHRAVQHFYLDALLPLFESILQNGASNDLNRKEEHGLQGTVLHIAVRQRNVSLVKFLLTQENVEPMLTDMKGNTPLHIAMQNDDDEIVQILLKHPKVLKTIYAENNQKDTFLECGLSRGSAAACKVLLENEHFTDIFSVNDKVKNLLSYVAWHDENAEILPLILEKIKITTDAFNKPDNQGYTPFFLAMKKKNYRVAKALLYDKRMDLTSTNPEGETPLHCAASMHDVEAVKFLIDKESNINAQKPSSNITPLHIAANYFSEYPEVFFFLFNHPKINVNMQSSDGQTAFYKILDKDNNIHIIEKNAHLLFNDPRVEIEVGDHLGRHLLYIAKKIDSIVIFKLLTDRLKLENKPLKTQEGVFPLEIIPDPETNLEAFLAHPSMQSSPQITAFYAALNILKTNQNLTCHEVFSVLAKRNFPCCENWSTKHQLTAFDHVRRTPIEILKSDLFALSVFSSDDFLTPKNVESLHAETDIEKILNAQTFFRITNPLPEEMKMRLCNIVYAEGTFKELIPSTDTKHALIRLALNFK